MKYETLLKEKKSSLKEVFIITVTADSNDGDYMTERTTINKNDMTDEVIDLINKLNKIKNVDYALTDIEKQGEAHGLTLDDLMLDIYIPSTDWGDFCHTLEDFEVEYIDENGKIFDVEFLEKESEED